MINKAFGIIKVFFTHEVRLNQDVMHFMDGENVSESSEWTEIHLPKPGSLQYDFEVINGVNVCKAVLNFNSTCEMYNDGKDVFFLAVDVNKTKHLIGLGTKYHTIPKVDMTDAISDSPADGAKQTIKVTWNNLCGRITAQ